MKDLPMEKNVLARVCQYGCSIFLAQAVRMAQDDALTSRNIMM